MAIQKSFLKSKPECKVTFSFDKNRLKKGDKVTLAGSFNQWNAQSHPLKGRKDGTLGISMTLPVGQEYEFRYVINQTAWENDEGADRYSFSEFAGTNNSVLSL